MNRQTLEILRNFFNEFSKAIREGDIVDRTGSLVALSDDIQDQLDSEIIHQAGPRS